MSQTSAGPAVRRSRASLVDWPKARLLRPALSGIAHSIAAIDPWYYYRARTLFRTFFLPIQAKKWKRPPPLRTDMQRFLPSFKDSLENLEKILLPFEREIRWPLGKVYNGYFQAVDAELYYCTVRTLRPREIIEVGSGNSAWIASEALERNRRGRIRAIDPYPTMIMPRGCEVLRTRVEETPLAMFGDLEEGDIVFMDSSHTTEEARFHIEHILPALPPGVVVHYHDIYFPYDLYFRDDRGTYGEPDVILDMLVRQPNTYRVITGAAIVHFQSADRLRTLVPSVRYDPHRVPSSLWLRKEADPER